MNRNKLKDYKILIWVLPALITLVFMIIVMAVCGITPFGNYSFVEYDCLQQYMPFFAELKNKMNLLGSEGVRTFFYSFNGGMGYNFLTIFFYYLASPLNLILLFFNKESLLSVISLLIVLKMSFSAGAMGVYLSRSRLINRNGEKRAEKQADNFKAYVFLIMAFSLGYALSSFMIGYSYNIMWLDIFALFPLVVLGLEKLMADEKPVAYIVLLFLCLSINYYISFMICIFLVLWFFVNYGKLSKSGDEVEEKKNSFVKAFLRFSLASILSAGMAAVPLIVSAASLAQKSSAANTFTGETFYNNIISLFSSQLAMIKPIKASALRGDANLYCGLIIIPLILIAVFSKKSIKEKIRLFIIPVILFVSMMVGALNYVWHGFHEQVGIPNRFAFLLIFSLLVIGYETICDLTKIGIKRVIPATAIASILPFVLYIFSDFNGLISSHAIIVISMLLLVVYAVFLISICSKKEVAYTCDIIISLIMIAELMFNVFMSVKYNDLEDSGYYMAYVDDRTASADYVKVLESGDEFYRESIYDNIINNEEIYHGMRGVSIFSSTIAGNIEAGMRGLGFSGADLRYYYSGSSAITDDLLGVKYIHMSVPLYEGRYGYERVFDENSELVYENDDALSIGYAVNRDVLEFIVGDEYNPILIQNNLLYAMTGEGGYVRPVEVSIEAFGNNCNVSVISGDTPGVGYESDGISQVEVIVDITVPESGEYMFDALASASYAGSILVNGVIIEDGVISNRVISLSLSEGDHVMFELFCAANGETMNSFPIIITRYFPEIEEKAINSLAEHELKLSDMKSYSLSGNIEIPDGKVLFTSIPYDSGWEIYDNGKRCDIVEVSGGFLGADIGSGNHELKLVYTPNGLIVGIVVGIVAWTVFIVLLVINQKNASRQK